MDDNNYSDFQSFPDAFDNNKDELKEVYHCKDCNTIFSFYGDNLENNKLCVFCNKESVDFDKIVDNDQPYIIPYVKSQDEAISSYRKKVLWNPFIPIYFKKKTITKDMKKIYIPGYSLDLHVEGSALFQAKDDLNKKKKQDNSKIYEVLLNTNIDYSDVILSQFSNFSDEMFDIICSNKISDLKEYSEALLKDCYVIKPNLTAEELSIKLRERTLKASIKTIKEGVKHQYKKIDQNNLTVNSNNVKQLLVPIYYLKTHYKEQDYYFIMNGESGKSYFTICYGKIGFVVTGIILFLVLTLISYFIVHYL